MAYVWGEHLGFIHCDQGFVNWSFKEVLINSGVKPEKAKVCE